MIRKGIYRNPKNYTEINRNGSSTEVNITRALLTPIIKWL